MHHIVDRWLQKDLKAEDIYRKLRERTNNTQTARCVSFAATKQEVVHATTVRETARSKRRYDFLCTKTFEFVLHDLKCSTKRVAAIKVQHITSVYMINTVWA